MSNHKEEIMTEEKKPTGDIFDELDAQMSPEFN